MNVFISWSGARSMAVAEALRSWLPRVIQAARPWMSEEDISAGSRWLSEVQSELYKSSLGIICVTPENQANPWLLFEAGALSKALTESHVCPLLLDLAPSQLGGPLAQFQASAADREGVERIVFALNRVLGPAGVPIDDLRETVDVWWPKLEVRIADALALSHNRSRSRPSEEILEEVVINTREQLRRENIRIESSRERDKRFDEFLGAMNSLFSRFQYLQERAFVAAQSSGKTDDVAKLMRSAVAGDMSQLQTVFGSLIDFSQAQKAFEERILKAPVEESPVPGESDGPK